MQNRVLIVEDHLPTLQLVTAALVKEGLDVAVAHNGAECLLAVEAQRPDLIVLDVKMPVMDGLQTLRVLRESDVTQSIPVIILSIRSEDRDVVRGLSAGADMYIAKPFTVTDLVTAVRRMLQVTGEKQ